MSRIELDYEELKQEMIEQIEKRKLKILATSIGGFVTAREIRFTSDGLNMFFLTDKRSRKYEQMRANPNVAISVGNLQIEGTASLKGQILGEKNSKYLEMFKKKQPESYESWTKSGYIKELHMSVIEVTSERVAVYRGKASHEAGPYLDVLNVVNEKAFRLKLLEDGYEAPAYRE